MKTEDVDHPSTAKGRELITAEPNTHVGEALVVMAEKGIHHLPVLDGDQVVGIVSDRDILRILAEMQGLEDPLEGMVSAVMRKDVPTISELSEVHDVLRIMREGNHSALPIVENGELTGIVTETDMLRALEKVLREQKVADGEAAATATQVVTNPMFQRVVHFLGMSGL